MIKDETTNPPGGKHFCWGMEPGVDILNMGKGQDVSQMCYDLDLLFAASGDMRSVVKTIAGLPDEYSGRCRLVINDYDFLVVARNAMLLLVAVNLEPDEAVPTMIHLWYSTLLPEAMVEILKKVVLDPINEVCEKIKGKPPASIQAKTFAFGKRSLRLVLEQSQWVELQDFSTLHSTFTKSDTQIVRRSIMFDPMRVDHMHRDFCNKPPSFRVAGLAFRIDGILLPYDASRDGFEMPNP